MAMVSTCNISSYPILTFSKVAGLNTSLLILRTIILLNRNGISFYQPKALYYEMYAACDAIEPEMTRGFFTHAGYLV